MHVFTRQKVYNTALIDCPFKYVTAGKRAEIIGNIGNILAVSKSLLAVLKERCVDK